MFKASGAVQRIGLCCVACCWMTASAADPKTEALIDFAALKPGAKVAHFLPISSDYTNALCKLVSDSGRVYSVSAPPAVGSESEKSVVAPSCASVIVLRSRNYPAPELYDSGGNPGEVYEYYASRLPVESFVAPEPLDLILIADRHRDLRGKTFGSVNMAFVYTALFKALRSGGVFIVADDHRRIDLELEKKEIIAAGFAASIESQSAGRRLLKFVKP